MHGNFIFTHENFPYGRGPVARLWQEGLLGGLLYLFRSVMYVPSTFPPRAAISRHHFLPRQQENNIRMFKDTPVFLATY